MSQQGAPAEFGAGDPRRLEQLRRLQSRQVRLVVSMPAIMVLVVVGLTLLVHFDLRMSAEAMPEPTIWQQIQDPQARAQALARERVRDYADRVLLIGAICAAVSGLVGLVIALQIVRPLRRIMTTMQEVSGGDLSTQLAVAQLGELGMLSSTFNQMMERLRDLFEERDRQMRDAAAGTLLTLDEEGRLLSGDTAAPRFLGATIQKAMGRRLDELLKPAAISNRAELKETLDQLFADGSTGHRVWTMLQVEGSMGETRTFSLTLSPMTSGKPGSGGYLLDLRDMTTRRDFYEQIQRADRLAAVGTLATGIAHEIRNPLASIKGMLQLMGDENATPSPDRAAEFLQRINSEVDRLNRLVSGIMEFAGQGESQIAPVSLNDLVREVGESLRHGFDPEELADVRVEWHLDESLPDVPLEENRIRQAFENLIRNAYEAVVGTGGTIRIETRYLGTEVPRPIQVVIANTGSVEAGVRERIFEPFYTTKADGTGLGLPISFQIIRANHGDLEFFQENGTVEFRVSFSRTGYRARVVRSDTPFLEPDPVTGEMPPE